MLLVSFTKDKGVVFRKKMCVSSVFIGKKIMMERSLQNATTSVNKMAVSRPNNLPNLQKDTDQSTQELLQKLYKTGRCHILLNR